MMDFQLHQNDLHIRNGDIEVTVDDTEAVSQAIKVRLKTLAGEWFLDSQIGIPYLTDILGQKHNGRFLRHLIQTELKGVPGIGEIRAFSAHVGSNRAVKVSFVASLNSGAAIPITESMEF